MRKGESVNANESGPRPESQESGPVGSGETPRSPSSANRRTSNPAKLTSLAPRYDPTQHKTYLSHLESAVTDPRNRNIALSGRYGTGKSSVLDEFENQHTSTTLRLAVSSLAPEGEDATLTNRIQKEVLKQLVYSARPRTLRHSRFNRRGPLSRWRASCESFLFVGITGALLALLGRLPSQIASGSNHSSVERILVWTLVAALLVVVITVIRLITYDRFVVSKVSAAGATLALSSPTNTYFDEYLDEIVYFFDQEGKDFVLFEDIDRYDDPQIFQALRELNTLLNNTPKRLKRIAKHQQPLRFIYAMRDSLFEKIGEDTINEGSGDAVRAETVRANRTKFFEIVIPLVPFISHRTAREHLGLLLNAAKITDVDRALVELVAKHVTDMRLMLNIRNEYLVFAERLLTAEKVAPDLSASNLFALVAYKNFHLEDFEKISRRGSDLDYLYDQYRELVTASIAAREQTKRDLVAKIAHPSATKLLARRVGLRLAALGKAELERANYTGWEPNFSVGSNTYKVDALTSTSFWEAVVDAGTISIQASQNPPYGSTTSLNTLSRASLEGLFPEVLRGAWEERNTAAIQETLEQLDRQINTLRGAGFQDLIECNEYTLTDQPANGLDAVEETDQTTFADVVKRNLKSELARDLVKHGYIDRNFSLYAAQFYGDFTGVDVATFVVQTVQTNGVDINYKFTSPGAIANLLAETDADFTRSVSAYNVQILDHLLVHDVDRADEVINHLISNFGDHAQQLLAACFTGGEQRTHLAAALSRQPWLNVYCYLADSERVPSDARTFLMEAAVLNAQATANYEFTDEVRDFLTTHYAEMSCFTASRTEPERNTIVTFLERANILLPALDGVHKDLRQLVVRRNLYEITADNLRTATSIAGSVSLDDVCADEAAYEYCLSSLGDYLDAVETDEDTQYAARTPETLVDAVTAAAEDAVTLRRLISAASPDSALQRLQGAPTSTWPELAAANMFRPSLTNVENYRAVFGEIDQGLGQLLATAGVIHIGDGNSDVLNDDVHDPDDEVPDKVAAAIAVLNARTVIPSPETRVQLVQSLALDEKLLPAQINAENTELFALLISEHLVLDDADTFAHLRTAGWSAVEPAVMASENVGSFLTPDLVDGLIVHLLSSPATANKVGHRIVGSMAEFIPADEPKSLEAAAKFAIQGNTPLPSSQIRRIAACSHNVALTFSLLQNAQPTASEIIEVLTALGGKYTYLTNWQEDEFEVPHNSAHIAVFKVLADANMCRTSKKRREPLIVVKRP